MKEGLEQQAKHSDAISAELEKAIAHAKTVAAHFRSDEAPRGRAKSTPAPKIKSTQT